MAKKTTIRCPHCGCEYLPGEIYYPDLFLGQPTNIIKDKDGNILGFNGEDMITSETFYCEVCDKQFIVDATVSFKAVPFEDLFSDDSDFLSEINSREAKK